jgi:hypothetical protein
MSRGRHNGEYILIVNRIYQAWDLATQEERIAFAELMALNYNRLLCCALQAKGQCLKEVEREG